MQAHELLKQFAISEAKVVLIDAGGSTIKWAGGTRGFAVSDGARLCILNAVVDGQGSGRAVYALDAGTKVQLRDVAFQNCYAAGSGAAVFLEENAVMEATSCTFRGNMAESVQFYTLL